MNEIKGLRKELPPMDYTFQVDVVGELTKKRFLGEFKCKIMTRKEQAMVDKHKAFLNGEMVNQLQIQTIRFHHQIAYLRYALVPDYPRFWKESDLGYDLYDSNVVEVVYNEVLKFEEGWVKEVWGVEAVKALRGDSDEQDSGDEKEDGKAGSSKEA